LPPRGVGGQNHLYGTGGKKGFEGKKAARVKNRRWGWVKKSRKGICGWINKNIYGIKLSF
jgi:hypothetical protein